MNDIIFLGQKNEQWSALKERFPAAKYAKDFEHAKKVSFTKFFWIVWDNVSVANDFDFSYVPDEWSQEYIHVFKNNEYYDGICLVPKSSSPSTREIKYRFFTNKKEVDVLASTPVEYAAINPSTYQEFNDLRQSATTEFVWVIPSDVDVAFDFDYQIPYWEKDTVHIFKNGEFFDGLFLVHKDTEITQREFEHRFFSNKKEIDIVASIPKPYEVFEIDSYDEYLEALENSTNDLFWMSSRNLTADLPPIYFSLHNTYDRKQNHAFIHRVGDTDLYNGVFLCSKHAPLSKREVEHRFPVNRKEHEVVASGPVKYDVFDVNTYEDYLEAFETTNTEMFWVIPSDVDADDNFKFDTYFTHDNKFDRTINHVFKNGDFYDGIILASTHSKISKKEFGYRFLTNKKEWDILASTPKQYDFYNIDSYEEYKYALENSSTEMFWASSRNIKVLDTFDLNMYFSHHNSYDRQQNHVFNHKFGEEVLYNGLMLLSKRAPLSKREIEHRFPVNRKEWNIVASTVRTFDVFEIDSYDEYLQALETSTTEMFWMTSRNVLFNHSIVNNYYLYHIPAQSHFDIVERDQNHAFIHQVEDKQLYNGVFLCSKHAPLSKREVEHRFPVSRIEHEVVASGPVQYDVFEIDSYDEYELAVETSTTEMFWMSSRNISFTDPGVYFTFDNEYDRKQNHAFIHRVNGKDLYNGAILCSKHNLLTKREVEHRHPVDRKEWNIVASGPVKYDVFDVNTYDDYLKALDNSKTEMFWSVPTNRVDVCSDFKFNTYFTHDNKFDRAQNHAFLNGKYHDGIFLCSKNSIITEKEFSYSFLTNKKVWDITASTPKPFDIVFISYQEPNAEENYQELLKRFPRAKRVHGVKGIHQAHIEAAKLSVTDMFWVVDGDAKITKDFHFDFKQVPNHDTYTKTMVHVWRSRNPINDLEYGYGGVKLLPKSLTLNVDVNSADMTTSISPSFKAMQQVSNITAFNTDPFNTWKSAFRECVKLASRTIQGQIDDETEERLKVWCTEGSNSPLGNYAIAGAIAGRDFGYANINNPEKLKLINNFDWLKEQFDAVSI